MGPTQSFNNNYSGWNIDDLIITGNYVQQDVGVSSWVTPVDGCGHTASDSVQVWVKNFGAEDVMDDIPLMYSFSGGVNVEVYDTIFGGIPYQDSVLFTFRTPVDLSTPYFYDKTQIYATALLPGDEDARNDKISTSLRVVPTYTPPYVEDFEGGFGFWTVLGEDNVWAHGMPTAVIIDGAASGNYAWVTNPHGTYNPGDSIYVESPCYDLTGVKNPVLQMEISSRLNAGLDGVAVQYSIDDGATWDLASTHSHPFHWNWYNADSIEGLGGPGWDTTYPDWTSARQFLPVNTANQSHVKFRIGLESAGGELREGFGFDDFTVYEAPVDVGVSELVYPYDTCDLSPTQEVVLAIKNYGIDTLHIGDSFMVEVAVNNEQWHRDTVIMDKNVPVGDTFHYQPSGTFDMYLAGNYHVKAYTISFVDDNIYADTLYNNDSIFDSVLVYKPYVFFGPDVYTVRPDTLVLDAFSDEGNLYTWQDGSTDSVFHVEDSGLYYVEVLNPNTLCTARDTIYIHRLVIDMEVSDWHGIASDCEIGDSVPITMELTNVGTDTIRYGYVIDFTYEVEDVAAVRETWVVPDTVKIAPDSSFLYTFSQALDMSAVREYAFVLYVDYPDDDDASNDTIYRQAEVYGYPDFQLSPSDTVHQGFSLLLDARQGNEEWVDFAWQDESTDSVFLVTEQGTGMYYCTVTDVYGCSSSDSSRVRLVIVDVEVAAIQEPLKSCGSMSDDRVFIHLMNAGTDTLFAGTLIPVSYQFDTLPLQQDSVVLTARFEPGDSLTFEFDSMVSFDGTGIYELSVYATLHNDSVTDNDTLVALSYLYELPVLNLGSDTSVLNEPSYTIEPDHYKAYVWSGGSTDSVFIVNYQNWFQRVYLTVTDSNDCQAFDDIKVNLDFLNLAIDTIMLEDTICELDDGMPVSIVVANKGTQVIPGYSIVYSLNEHDTIENVISNSLGLMAKRQHTIYSNIIEQDEGSYTLYLALDVVGSFYQDIVPEDDSVFRQYNLYGLPDVVWEDVNDDTLSLDLDFPYALGLGISYASYVWEDSVSLDPTLVVYEDGWYQVRVMDANGCFNTDSIYVLGPIGIDHPLYGTITVHYYPVPVRDILHVELATEVPGQLMLDIISMQGKKLSNRSIEIAAEAEVSFDMSGFSPGVYLLQIRGRNLLYRGRIIVE